MEKLWSQLILGVLAVSFSSQARAYEVYEAKSFRCRDGGTIGLVIAEQIGIVTEPNPQKWVKYYCNFDTIRGLGHAIESRDEDMPAQLKACRNEHLEKDSALLKCYENEFSPKCVVDKLVQMHKCFESFAPTSGSQKGAQ